MHLATTEDGNALLARDPLALLLGMLLDQRNRDHRNNGAVRPR